MGRHRAGRRPRAAVRRATLSFPAPSPGRTTFKGLFPVPSPLLYHRESMEQPADLSSTPPTAVLDRQAAAGAAPAARRRLPAEARPLLVAMRPRQWVKNGLVFLALIFSVGQAWRIGDPGSLLPLVGRATLAFVAFCAVASAEYLVNDLCDIASDRLHPRKRRRPLAAGVLRTGTAATAAAVLLGTGLLLGLALGWYFVAALGGYAALALSYSFVLKHVVIVDMIALAIGFVLRAVGGALAIEVPVSPWLYLCTLLGALFIAINKRRNELMLLADGASDHRPILAEYTPGLLDQMAGVVTSSTVVAYALYTVTAENLPSNHAMLATVPYVIYGIFRYMYLVHRHDAGGNPEDVLLRDRPMQLTVALWVLTAMVILAVYR
jgi:4-hydroxybenzoate polyprenyltransferase